MSDEQIRAMAQLRQAVTAAKFKIFAAQDFAPLALRGRDKDIDRVSISLTTIRGALEQLDNTIQMLAMQNLPVGPDPQAGQRNRRVRKSRPGGSL